MTKESSNLRFAVLATDVLLFTVSAGKLLVRLIPVDRPPHFEDMVGLPGGLIKPEETALEAARRCLSEKGLVNWKKVYLEQLYTFSDVARDPRGRVVSVVYLGCIAWEELSNVEKENQEMAFWLHVSEAFGLAYDHDQVLELGLKRLSSKIKYSTLISKILPKEFSLSDFQSLFELITGQKQDKRNFRKKIDQLNILTPVGKKSLGKKSRPAELYCFSEKQVIDLDMINSVSLS